jgi:hypothetical protein
MEFTEYTEKLILDGIVKLIGEDQGYKYRIFKFKSIDVTLSFKGSNKEIIEYEEVYLDNKFMEYIIYYKDYKVVRDQMYLIENVRQICIDDDE